MEGALKIDGNQLCPIRVAAEETSYSRDYITRLAREKRIVASYIGRKWFVDLGSLKAYADSAALEQEVRRKQLREERKREREMTEQVAQERAREQKKARTIHARAVATASFVLACGLLGGWGFQLVLPLQSMSTWPLVPNSENQHSLLPAQAVHSTQLESAASQTPMVRQWSGAASSSMHELGDINEGFLLLPQATSTVNMLFSDAVVVQELVDGTRVVVRVDAAGRPVGNSVPFVVVPVSSSRE
ncbi:hypothetical protein KC906_01320 [Candidatus Kaiserbacteria bacterium]|nr:hypothetical protein [Candidatus Kaiserbacteria bacterium]